MINIFELQLDEVAVENANERINYFNNIPKHIRGLVSNFKYDLKNNEDRKPAKVIEGLITVKGGALNIPGLAFSY